jgi:hypothetical protein
MLLVAAIVFVYYSIWALLLVSWVARLEILSSVSGFCFYCTQSSSVLLHQFLSSSSCDPSRYSVVSSYTVYRTQYPLAATPTHQTCRRTDTHSHSSTHHHLYTTSSPNANGPYGYPACSSSPVSQLSASSSVGSCSPRRGRRRVQGRRHRHRLHVCINHVFPHTMTQMQHHAIPQGHNCTCGVHYHTCTCTASNIHYSHDPL